MYLTLSAMLALFLLCGDINCTLFNLHHFSFVSTLVSGQSRTQR